jgi:uncharacterized damage-inducible protein DinB
MDFLDRLLGHDEYTTRRLLEISSELNEHQLDQTFDLGHGTLLETFAHIIGNVETWTDLMNGWEIRPPRKQGKRISDLLERFDSAYKDFAQLAQKVRSEDRWNKTWLDVLDNPPKAKTYGGTIAHLITHSMHHRAQAIHMLKRLGIAGVPEGDVLSWEHSRVEGKP